VALPVGRLTKSRSQEGRCRESMSSRIGRLCYLCNKVEIATYSLKEISPSRRPRAV